LQKPGQQQTPEEEVECRKTAEELLVKNIPGSLKMMLVYYILSAPSAPLSVILQFTLPWLCSMLFSNCYNTHDQTHLTGQRLL
jgi:hypothetical protein